MLKSSRLWNKKSLLNSPQTYAPEGWEPCAVSAQPQELDSAATHQTVYILGLGDKWGEKHFFNCKVLSYSDVGNQISI